MQNPKRLTILLVILAAALLALGAFYTRQWYVARQPISTPRVSYSSTPVPSYVATPLPTPLIIRSKIENWKVFSNKELGISFQYPTEFQYITFDISSSPDPKISSGKFAHGLIMTEECPNIPCRYFVFGLGFGGVTPDFGAPRGSTVYENGGFLKENDKYYTKVIQTINGPRKLLLSPKKVVITSAGTEGLLFAGDGALVPGGEPINARWLVFNLKSSPFQAITFYNPDVNILSEPEFIKVFKTLEIK